MKNRLGILKITSILLIAGAVFMMSRGSFLMINTLNGGNLWLAFGFTRKISAITITALAEAMTLPGLLAGIWGLLFFGRQCNSVIARVLCILAVISAVLYMLALNLPLTTGWGIFEILVLALYWMAFPSTRKPENLDEETMEPLKAKDWGAVAGLICIPLAAVFLCRTFLVQSSAPSAKLPEDSDIAASSFESPEPALDDFDEVIISPEYDPYLEWKFWNYDEATQDEKLNAAKALLLYYIVLDTGQRPLPDSEIESASAYADEHQEKLLELTDTYFKQAFSQSCTLRQSINYGYMLEDNSLLELEPGTEIELFGYTEYLYYTGTMFMAADSEEQEQVMVAALLYVMKYRLEQEVTEDDVPLIADIVHNLESVPEDSVSALYEVRLMFEAEPDKTLKELLDQY